MIADVRYSFTNQFLRGAALFARRAREIEEGGPSTVAESLQTEHRACVVAAVMQAVAALEAEIWEITSHGPGHHLGSDGNDRAARAFLAPLAEFINRQPTLDRYEAVLYLLQKPPLEKGKALFQAAELLVKARNELVHYKSEWEGKMEGRDFYKRLTALRLLKAPFVSTNAAFFPHRFLNSSAATWAVSTAEDFINSYFVLLGFPSPLISKLELPKKLLEPRKAGRLRRPRTAHGA